jgi:hypothetical protein
LFTVAFVTSGVWVVLVRRIAIGSSVWDVISYSLGSALGVVLAKELHSRISRDLSTFGFKD